MGDTLAQSMHVLTHKEGPVYACVCFDCSMTAPSKSKDPFITMDPIIQSTSVRQSVVVVLATTLLECSNILVGIIRNISFTRLSSIIILLVNFNK